MVAAGSRRCSGSAAAATPATRAEGDDTVYTSLASYALVANVEAVVFDGAGNFYADGTAAANLLFGGADRDSLNGDLGLDSFIVTGAQLTGSGMSIDGGVEWDSLVFAGNVTGGVGANFANMSGLDVMLFTGTGAQSVALGDAAGLTYGGVI